MRDESADEHVEHPVGDNRADFAESQAKMAEERFDALLAALPCGDTSVSAGGIALSRTDEQSEDEVPFAAPLAVTRITLRRIDGTRAEVDQFKKGFHIGSWTDADETLRKWATTVPEGTTQRVAYVVELIDDTRLYGTFPLAQEAGSFRSWVIEENELAPAYLKAT